jgi:uncharacterized repeat protein (TIGR01451 family)
VTPLTGTVVFKLYAPSDATCTGTPFFTSAAIALTGNGVPSGAASATSTPAQTAIQAGTWRWVATYQDDPNYTTPVTSGCDAEPVVVQLFTPGDPTMATPTGPVRVGQPIEDSVTLIGENGLPAPSGTVIFRLFGPNDTTCSRPPVLTSAAETLSEVTPPTTPPTSTATVTDIAPGPPGTYTWEVQYTPDAASADIFAARLTCGGNHEQVTTVPMEVSLSVTKTVSPNPYTPGDPLTYAITVHNGGPDTANPATVNDPFPTQLQGASFTWTCTATGTGTSCGAATGTAPPLHDTPVIAPGGTVTYTVTGTVPSGTTGVLENTVTVTPPPGVMDPGCPPDCTASASTSPSSAPAVPGLPPTGAPAGGGGPLTLALLLLDVLGVFGLVGGSSVWLGRLKRRRA